MKMLSHPREPVVKASLETLVALMEGGHPDCQNSLLNYFQNTAEEQFFTFVKERLSNSMVSIKEARVLTAMKEARLAKEREVSSKPTFFLFAISFLTSKKYLMLAAVIHQANPLKETKPKFSAGLTKCQRERSLPYDIRPLWNLGNCGRNCRGRGER